jgi:1,4-alpha-glucan branching enzyme
MYLIDHLHQKGIGVILDWVPSHFPSDSYSLSFFDGTYLYEHSDPRKGFHPEWKSCVFNCGRNEVKNFLISNAAYWIDKYHADGLRVDAVASMLYLDYSRKRGEWVPNIYGDRENLEAIEFLRDLNKFLYEKYPGIQTIAEESTAWPMVTRPPYLGGLGFGYKWNMGWMHDVLSYMEKEPVYRKYHHGQLTFTLWYAFNENFVLPLSHDEVVYGKRSLAGKMPGDDWQKLANLRLLFGYMFTHPGKKHLFMGGEFGQWGEWDHDSELEWHLLDKEQHRGVQKWVSDLNRLYRNERALFDKDVESEGFQWINLNDQDNSVISFLRSGKDMARCLVVACNFTPVVRYDYLLGVPFGGEWKEIINSDSELYGGSGVGNLGRVNALDDGSYGRDFSIRVTLPPLGMVVLKHGDIEDVGGSKV